MPPRLACVRSRTQRPADRSGTPGTRPPESAAQIPPDTAKRLWKSQPRQQSTVGLAVGFMIAYFLSKRNKIFILLRSLRSTIRALSEATLRPHLLPWLSRLHKIRLSHRLWTLCPPPGAFSMLASAWRLPFPAAQSAAPYSVRRCFWHPVSVHRFARSGSPD